MRVLVTGGSGFVGKALLAHLVADGSFDVVAAMRQPRGIDGVRVVPIDDIGPETDWEPALQGVDAVIHCAGLAHRLGADAAGMLSEFRQVNSAGTRRLAEQAAASSVCRLVFLSSVKVLGEATTTRSFTDMDALAPLDPYGVSKSEAELALRAISEQTGLETVILRPPLIYGPHPKSNMLRLLRWVSKGIPLPFAAVDNRRSLISLRNLNSAILACVTHEQAAGQTYLVSDQSDISTPDLVRHIAQALGRPDRLWPMPVALLRLGGALAGRSDEVQRLIGSLVVDSSRISDDLGWRPVQSIEDGIAEMVASSLAQSGANRSH